MLRIFFLTPSKGITPKRALCSVISHGGTSGVKCVVQVIHSKRSLHSWAVAYLVATVDIPTLSFMLEVHDFML